MGFRFSRPIAANLANYAKSAAASGIAASQADANRANRANPVTPFDDRIYCTDCSQLALSGVCRAAGPRHKPVVAACGYRPIRDLPRRCEGFTPYGDHPDLRRGFERWPGLAAHRPLPDPAAGSHATPPGVDRAPLKEKTR